MKVVLLAGGLGTRISEETVDKPKPMVLLDDKPILWHLMSIFASQGYQEFLIATGYKSEVIDDWVSTLNEKWSVETLFTGQNTQTGGRIKECMKLLPGERVFATYGDGLANVNLNRLLDSQILYLPTYRRIEQDLKNIIDIVYFPKHRAL